jgi:pilus assembly protein CpaE
MLRIAIVDPSDSTRDPLRSLLLGIDFVFLESESHRYEFFIDVIAESPPDLVIVGLDADKTRSQQLVNQLAHDYPHTPVLVISVDNQAILQCLQRGAKHFLTQPVVLEDLLVTLRKVQAEAGLTTPGSPAVPTGLRAGRTIAVLGTRGGAGGTTLAVNLAATLAADRANSVALVDLDLALGDCDITLDVMADHTLADLALNIDKLDLNFMKRSLLKHEPTGLFLLAHPLQMSDVTVIQPAHVERVLNLLRINYTHLVLDLSKGFTPVDLVALDMADDILLVSQLELSSLRNVVRMLMTLYVQEGMSEKVRVIANRVGSDFSESAISLKKAEYTIGRPIFWQVPHDSKAVLGARVEGQPLVLCAPKSRAHQSILGLAQALTERPAPEAAKAGGGFFKGIFSNRK